MKVIIKIEVSKSEMEQRIADYLDCNPPRPDLREHIMEDMIEEFLADKTDYIYPEEIEVVEV